MTDKIEFVGGPWDGQMRDVGLHPHIAVPYYEDLSLARPGDARAMFRIHYYRLERRTNGVETEYRYVDEDAACRGITYQT